MIPYQKTSSSLTCLALNISLMLMTSYAFSADHQFAAMQPPQLSWQLDFETNPFDLNLQPLPEYGIDLQLMPNNSLPHEPGDMPRGDDFTEPFEPDTAQSECNSLPPLFGDDFDAQSDDSENADDFSSFLSLDELPLPDTSDIILEQTNPGTPAPTAPAVRPKNTLPKAVRKKSAPKNNPEPFFPCTVKGCSYKTINPELAKAHIYGHEKGKKFSCVTCNYGTSERTCMIVHLATHTSEKPYKCDVAGCDYAAAISSHLSEHIRKHTEKKPYKCDVAGCDYATTNPSNLIRHKRKHTGAKPFKCDVPGCSYAATQMDNLKTHQRKHTGEKPYVCGIGACAYAAAQKNALISHLKIIHKHDQGQNTPTTDKRKRNDSAHETEIPHIAVARATTTPPHIPDALISDQDTVLHPPKRPCLQDETPSTKLSTTQGLQEVATSSADTLTTKYQSDKTVDLPNTPSKKSFKCSVEGCVFASALKSNLKRHITVKHTNEKPFKCNFDGCTYETAYSCDLTMHQRTHTGEKPYVCGIGACAYAAAKKSALNSHLKNKHKDDQGQNTPTTDKRKRNDGAPVVASIYDKIAQTTTISHDDDTPAVTMVHDDEISAAVSCPDTNALISDQDTILHPPKQPSLQHETP